MKWIIGALSILFLNACEKNIDFDLETSEPILVVDARIESNHSPVVLLNRSLDFFGSLSPQIIAASFVRDAEVMIINAADTARLIEYEISLLPGISLFYYSTDTTAGGDTFRGEFDKTYQLIIREGNKEYRSVTRIPALAAVPDSVWLEPAPFNTDSLKRIMKLKATDPPGLGNYIRYFTKTNSEPFYPGENSVYTDAIFDGDPYEVRLPRGFNRNSPPGEENNYYFKGDTVTLKFCNIDQATYTFWNTWEYAFQSIGNPFAQPGRVIGNISNGALGAFCGYAVWQRTFVAD